MEEVLSELAKPIWWVSVVIAGIVINLLSAYVKPQQDNFFSKLFNSIKLKNEKKFLKERLFIESLVKDPALLSIELFAEARIRNQSVYNLLLGIFVMLGINTLNFSQESLTIFYATSAGFFFLSYSLNIQAGNKAYIISEVTNLTSASNRTP